MLRIKQIGIFKERVLSMPVALKLMAMVLLLSLTATVNAKTYTLSVKMNDGNVYSYAISDKPVVAFSGGTMNIVSNNTQSTYNIADVEYWKFDEVVAGIDNIETEDVKFTLYDNHIEFTNIKADDNIEIFSVDGKAIKAVRTTGEVVSIPFSELGKGIAIIKINDKSIKVQIK